MNRAAAARSRDTVGADAVADRFEEIALLLLESPR